MSTVTRQTVNYRISIAYKPTSASTLDARSRRRPSQSDHRHRHRRCRRRRLARTLAPLTTTTTPSMARSSRLISTSLLLALVASAACLATAQASSKSAKRAVCFLADPTGTSSVVGRVVLSQSGNGATTLNGTIDGLAAGLHGFHIHELGDITGGCTSTGRETSDSKPSGSLNPKPQTLNPKPRNLPLKS
mmetsp:Transcript_13175/g.21423  ORF Transcript_13175/g.21423 Transcript_13175/m.21423 type:complete len:190 (+) Transcript_13175:690-1259(+)